MAGKAESARFLLESRNRVDLLDVLKGEGELTERDLREKLDCSRTTVHRNLKKLVKQGWVAESGGTYSVTTCGEFATEKLDEMILTVETASRLRPFLRWVPRSALDIDITAFQDASITVPEPGNPLAAINKHVHRLKNTEQSRTLLPVIGLHPYEVCHKRIQQGQLKAEFVVSDYVAETITAKPDYAEFTREMISTDRFDVFVYDEDIPYYLGILDETVQLGADESGDPRALVESTADEVRSWAAATYRSYKEDSVPLGEFDTR